MSSTESVSVHISSRTVITLTPLVPAADLETLRTQLECNTTPSWLSIKNSDASLTEYLNDRKAIAEKGSGGASVTFHANCITETPAPFRSAVQAIERGEVPLKDVRKPDEFEFPSRDDAFLHVRGTIDETGDFMSAPSVSLVYETGDLGLEHVRTFEEGETACEELELAHNDVVRNADASMDWVRKSDMRATKQHATDDWLEFLWKVGVEGQVTDGHFENDAPPFDYTELLDNAAGCGRLMYYAYRYHGWDYSVNQLEADLESLTHKYGDGGYLFV